MTAPGLLTIMARREADRARRLAVTIDVMISATFMSALGLAIYFAVKIL